MPRQPLDVRQECGRLETPKANQNPTDGQSVGLQRFALICLIPRSAELSRQVERGINSLHVVLPISAGCILKEYKQIMANIERGGDSQSGLARTPPFCCHLLYFQNSSVGFCGGCLLASAASHLLYTSTRHSAIYSLYLQIEI